MVHSQTHGTVVAMGLLLRFRRYALNISITDEYEGILLVDASLNKVRDKDFREYAKQALSLIEQTDPRRFRRVQAEITYLANSSLESNGNYERDLKCCNIDFAQVVYRCRMMGEAFLIANLACIIVHEATHGRIYSYGIPYEKPNWIRIERLCIREESHFAERLQDYCWCSHQLVSPLNEEGLLAFLSRSPWQRIKGRYVRLWQDYRESKREN